MFERLGAAALRSAWFVLAALAIALLPSSAAALEPVAAFGPFGISAGQMREPANGDFAPNGNFYVADRGNNRIDVFSAGGDFLFAFGREVNAGGGDPNVCTVASGCQAAEQTPVAAAAAGAMSRPNDVAFDAAGAVYVIDEGNNRVDVFSAGGEFQYALGRKVGADVGEADACTDASGCQAGLANGEAGAMSQPTGLEVVDGRLYVADHLNNRIDVFDLQARTFLYAFGKDVGGAGESVCTSLLGCQAGTASEEAGAMNRPYMLVRDQSGWLEITDQLNHRVDVFTTAGSFEEAYGREVDPAGGSFCHLECVAGENSATAGGLVEPTAIVVPRLGARVVVADAGTNRINEFNLGGFFRRAYGLGVDDGAAAFQVCSSVTICQAGLAGTAPGAVSSPHGVAAVDNGNVLAIERGGGFARVEEFGDVRPEDPPTPRAEPRPEPILVTLLPSNSFGFGERSLNRNRGTAVLRVELPGPGVVGLSGTGVDAVRRLVPVALSPVALPVRPRGDAKRHLLRRGWARVGAAVTFTPHGGTARTEVVRLKLRMTKDGGR